MQHGRIPRGVCLEIEKLQRDFIRGDNENQRKLHHINWKTLCAPKHDGGLGLRKLKSMNDAFLLKILWQLRERPNTLCSKVISYKHCNGNIHTAQPVARSSDSPLWKELVKLWPTYKENTICIIGNGLSTNLWLDPWVEETANLLSETMQNITDLESTVWEWTDNEENWDNNKLRRFLPEEVVHKITATLPPAEEHGDDRIG
ncbi:hypothetical protein AHAS_Ahas15G0167600 [Arachis hypogaea]